MFFRKDSNNVAKSLGGSISKPLLYDDYAKSVFSITTDYLKEDENRVFVRSLTNRYNKTKDIYAASKNSEIEAEEVRRGLEEFDRLTGMDVAKFCIEHTPAKLDKREDMGEEMYEEFYRDDKLCLCIPTLNIPKNKKSVLCKVKDEYGDEQLYDLQPSGAIHPHGMPSKLVNELINTLPRRL